MRDVVITNEPGVLSGDFNHHAKLKVGDTQKMVFGDRDNLGNPETGPFYWTEEDKIRYRMDETDGHTTKDLIVAELRDSLKTVGVDSGGKKADLLKRCRLHVPPIPTQKTVVNVTKEGWYGKPKGVFQILWERGYIDKANKHRYTMKGTLDDDGNLNNQ
jgi:hypothetical protein